MKTSQPHEYGSNIYAVGDVHGCIGMLKQLLTAISADALKGGVKRPRLIMLGDLVDRGPDSKGVLDLVMSRQFADEFDATVLRGNHDHWMLDVLRGSREQWMVDALNGKPGDSDSVMAEVWMDRGGAETVESFGIDFNKDRYDLEEVITNFRDTLHPKYAAFIERTQFSVQEGGFYFTHAGINPQNTLADQIPLDLMWIREDFLTHIEKFEAVVVHGHTPTESHMIEIKCNRIAVDTGAGFSDGHLSAAVIASTGEVRSISVGMVRCQDLDIADTDTLKFEPVFSQNSAEFGSIRPREETLQ